MTGTVGDFSISAEGPTWLVDTMERYDPSLVLKKVPKGGHKTFSNRKNHRNHQNPSKIKITPKVNESWTA